jgi:hypothetical protein
LGLPVEQQAIYTERRLRRIVRLLTEEEQVKAFEELRRSVEAYGNWGTHPAGPRLPRPRPAR